MHPPTCSAKIFPCPQAIDDADDEKKSSPAGSRLAPLVHPPAPSVHVARPATVGPVPGPAAVANKNGASSADGVFPEPAPRPEALRVSAQCSVLSGRSPSAHWRIGARRRQCLCRGPTLARFFFTSGANVRLAPPSSPGPAPVLLARHPTAVRPRPPCPASRLLLASLPCRHRRRRCRPCSSVAVDRKSPVAHPPPPGVRSGSGAPHAPMLPRL